MLVFGVGKRAQGPDRNRVGVAGECVTKFPPFGPLRVVGGGEHLFHSAVSGVEVHQGEECIGVMGGHCDNY